MNLIQLSYFQAAARYLSISKAAEALHISQPSLSSAIQELEREFGVILFRRHHRGVALTKEGAELLKLCGGLLNHADTVKEIMRDLGEKRKNLRLGVPPMIGSLLLPQIYKEFATDNKDIQMDIYEGGRQELLHLLSEDLLDMVFLPHNAAFEAELSSLLVSKIEVVCCMSKKRWHRSGKMITPQDLKGVPVVLFKNSFFQTEEIKKWFAAGGIEPDIVLQTDQLSTLQNLISHDVAAGFLFRQLVEQDKALATLSLSPPMRLDVSLVWKKSAYMFHSMERFLTYIKEKRL